MANVQRWVTGNPNTRLVSIKSGVTVELGDLMFLDEADDLRVDGDSTANNYAYPLEYFRISGGSVELNKRGVKDYFLGVAMDDKDGVGDEKNEQKLSIATAGRFVFDLKPAKTIKTGFMLAPTGTTTASNMYNQKVAYTTDGSIAIGYFAEYKVHAREAEVYFRTKYAPNGVIS